MIQPLSRNLHLGRQLVAITILAAALLSPSITAQALSGESIWIADTDWPMRHIELADLNGDDVDDVIAGELSTDYYGKIHHVFAFDGKTGDTIWVYTVFDGVRSMAIGDLNGDEISDVAVGASYNSGDTPDGDIHAIDGSTGLPMWVYPVNATMSAICVGDFDGDGFGDVAAGSFDDNIYAIDGITGAIMWVEDIGSLWINDVFAADVNDDGSDDVAFAHEYLTGYDNYVGVLNGNNGSAIWQESIGAIGVSVIVEDVDSDGSLEAAFTTIDGGDVGHLVVRDALSGAIEWEYVLGSIDHTNGELGLHTHDIDDDADLDLLVSNYLGWRYIYAFEGDTAAMMWSSDSLDSYPRDLAFGDITGDGNLDIAAAAWDRVLVVSAQTGEQLWYYAVSGLIYDVATALFDGDAAVDIVAGGTAEAVGTPPNPGKTVWALRTAVSPVWWEYQFGEYGNAIAIDDMNGDEFMDVLTVASLDDWVWALDGKDGTPLFNWVGTENLYTLTTGDFDGNGQVDVAVGGNDDMVTAVNGATATPMWQSTDPGDQIYRKCLATADLNDDGAIDVIAGSDDGNIYAIDGASGTKSVTLLWTAVYSGGDVEEVEVAEMNGTPPLDVVAIAGGRLVVLDGDDGSELWVYDVNTANAVGCEVLDANDDGILDVGILVRDPSGYAAVIDGFSYMPLWQVAGFSPGSDYTLTHARCNDDKADDLVLGGNYTDMTVRALNGINGDELWSYVTGDEVNCVLGADINGDEQDDILVGGGDHIVRAIDGMTGVPFFEYSCVGEVMHLAIGDVSGDGALNLACVTFGSDGVVYVFNSMYEAGCCVGITGNIDGDSLEEINIADLVYMVTYMFQGGPEPPCMDEADVDGNGAFADIADLVYLVDYMFQNGPDPVDCP